MESLTATKREQTRKKVDTLRKTGFVPGVLYGPKVEATSVQVDAKEFQKVYEEAGESSLVNLRVEGKEMPVLIHEVQKHPLSEAVLHVDFYQPDLTKKVEITVPLAFEGEALAVSELGGTLIHNIQEVEVKALPQDLPHEIKVYVERLATFEDRILVKDLVLRGVKTRDGEEPQPKTLCPLLLGLRSL